MYNDTITGEKCDRLPAGIPCINVVIYERIADEGVLGSRTVIRDAITRTEREYINQVLAAKAKSTLHLSPNSNSSRQGMNMNNNNDLMLKLDDFPVTYAADHRPKSGAERMRKCRTNLTVEQNERESTGARERMAALRSTRRTQPPRIPSSGVVVQPHRLGKMDQLCVNCGAKHFADEVSRPSLSKSHS
jgi:hypothetical protein